MEARNPSYPGWAAAGHLIVTPGGGTDFAAIEDDLRDLCARFDMQSVAKGAARRSGRRARPRTGGRAARV